MLLLNANRANRAATPNEAATKAAGTATAKSFAAFLNVVSPMFSFSHAVPCAKFFVSVLSADFFPTHRCVPDIQ
jgi:hypothetical protein